MSLFKVDIIIILINCSLYECLQINYASLKFISKKRVYLCLFDLHTLFKSKHRIVSFFLRND